MNELSIAPRMQELDVSAGLGIVKKVRALRQQGKTIIDFMSRPNSPTRAKSAVESMLHSQANCFYTDIRGWLPLRQTIATKLQRENNIVADPHTQIIVTAGAMGALSASLLALVGPGDDVIVDDPCFHAFGSKVTMAGGTVVRVPLRKENGFRFDIDALRGHISPRTKLLFLCNPDNPTGMVRTREELETVAQLAEEFNFHVLVDEAYEHFVFDGLKHISMASLAPDNAKIITVQSASKTYHMHGWRVGWVVAHEAVLNAILTAHATLTTCPNSFAQAGVIAAIEDGLGEGDVPIPEMVSQYAQKRDLMVAGMNAMSGVSCPTPAGAYFVFPDFSALGVPSVDLCHHLLDVGGVSSTPGSAFGPNGEFHLRLNYNSPVAELEQGLAKMADALKQL
jgi:aspartate aminotransferase